MGKSKFSTWSTFWPSPPPKSNPRAARSVHTMTTAVPSSKSPSTNSRIECCLPSTVMSPLYITTGTSLSLSANSTAWHDGIVLQNTMVFFPARKSPATICSITAILSTEPGQSTKRCFRLGADLCSEGVSMITKSSSSSRIIRTTFSDIVADTTTALFVVFPSGCGFLSGRKSRLISSPKPASNSVSASSSTTCVTADMNKLPSSMCLIKRPGVPTTTSSGRSSCCRCVANLSPPMMSSLLKRA
mmetsp:Transcript_14669/g.61914  ORF Transcript_14669/g.61914 Transcript_14669/m.61914 type:complete len:244 (-) Transcript_14669:384-1115(-)